MESAEENVKETFNPYFISSKTVRINNGKLIIPADQAKQIRACDPPRCFVTIGPDRLLIFPLQSWKDLAKKLKKSKNPTYRRLLHRYRKFGYLTTELDKSNRFHIAPIHLAFLQNAHEVVVSGHEDHLEVYHNEDYSYDFNRKDRPEDNLAPEDLEFEDE